jgi:hypothetical protein
MTTMPTNFSGIGNERRSRMPAVPFGIEAHLTELQRLALNRLSNFGWSLAFVRRPQGAPWTVVVSGPDRTGHAILTEDGDLDRDTPLVVRC